VECLKCHGGWIAIYNGCGVVRVSLFPSPLSRRAWAERNLTRQTGALRLISRYHGAIRDSMNNNVLIYLPVREKKTKSPWNEDPHPRPTHPDLSLVIWRTRHVQLKVPGSSPRNKIDRRRHYLVRVGSRIPNSRFHRGTKLNVSIRDDPTPARSLRLIPILIVRSILRRRRLEEVERAL